MKVSVLFILLTQFLTWSDAVQGGYFGVVEAVDAESGNQGFYCMVYNAEFHPIPASAADAELLPVADLTPNQLCDEPEKPPDVRDMIAAVSRGNCTFSEKARHVQEYGGKVALIVSSTGLDKPGYNSTTDLNVINISVALMLNYDFQKLKALGNKVSARVYAPDAPRVDFNFILIWVMAVGTLIIGAFWSGLVKEKQRVKRLRLTMARDSPPSGAPPEPEEEEEETFDVSPKLIFIFVVLMCGMLISLYFLYDYLVYAIIALFTVASSAALYECLKLVLIRLPCIGTCRIPANRIPLLSQQPEVRRLVLAGLCLAVGIWWAVERNKDYSWILQDILGIVFCIHMLKTVRLSSLRACTILLVLLFFYDIFFVFITPLITKTGQSIMVDVATGGDSSTGEMLPMVLKVPRFTNSVLSVCSLPFSLLGFGDILVPGLLVAYCHGFDLKVRSRRVYFISTTIAYGVGLVMTFVALALMESGQPALLYLVPCTLITVTIVGARRGELPHLWRGELLTGPTAPRIEGPGGSSIQNGEVGNGSALGEDGTSGGEGKMTTDKHSTTPTPTPTPGCLLSGDANLENSSLSSDNEQQSLIQR